MSENTNETKGRVENPSSQGRDSRPQRTAPSRVEQKVLATKDAVVAAKPDGFDRIHVKTFQGGDGDHVGGITLGHGRVIVRDYRPDVIGVATKLQAAREGIDARSKAGQDLFSGQQEEYDGLCEEFLNAFQTAGSLRIREGLKREVPRGSSQAQWMIDPNSVQINISEPRVDSPRMRFMVRPVKVSDGNEKRHETGLQVWPGEEVHAKSGSGKHGWLMYLVNPNRHELVLLTVSSKEDTVAQTLVFFLGRVAGGGMISVEADEKLPMPEISAMPWTLEAVAGKAKREDFRGSLSHSPLAEQLAEQAAQASGENLSEEEPEGESGEAEIVAVAEPVQPEKAARAQKRQRDKKKSAKGVEE